MLIVQWFNEFSSIAMKFNEICCIYDTKTDNPRAFCDTMTTLIVRSTLTASPMTCVSIFPLYEFIIVASSC